jgi:CheY-like chemotaxis protein
MPDMSGFDVVEHLRTHPELVVAPIMMLTSEGQRGDAARCRELGIAAYLLKPYSQADLFRAIMTTLGFADVDNAPLVTRHSLKHNKHNLHILLAEDNAVNQTLAVRLLNKFGHIVEIANNGLEAVAKWQGGEFDLILMDVDMPELNGYDATTQIRAHEKQRGGHIPIVGLTAHAMQGVREECLRQGMDGYLSKPIDTEALWIELESIMAAKPVVNQLMMATDSEFSFSMDKALALMDNDMELFCEMVKIYVEDAPGYRDKLGQAIEQGDCSEIKHLAHTIKGMVSIFAVPAVAKIAGRIELSESGDYHQDYDELKQALLWLTETLSVAVAAVETE